MLNLLTKLAEQQTLSREEASLAMELMLQGNASSEEIAGFLVGLRARGETSEELTGLAATMRNFAVPVVAPPHAVDIVGTGGDRSGSFNISTATAFVCRGAGATVAKHGNRSVSSLCGSADVLEALGVKTKLGKQGVEYCLDQAGMAFIFAPYFHPSLKYVMPVRKALGVRTCFNILGPLCNPAGVKRHLIGAFSKEIAAEMARILVNLGSERVFCVHAEDGLDEISISGPTHVFWSETTSGTSESAIKERLVVPEEFGFERSPLSSIIGGDLNENANILLRVLNNEKGPKKDIVALNAGFALVAAGVADSIENGISKAKMSIESGAALLALEQLKTASQSAPDSNITS